MDAAAFRAEFPVLDRIAYLNAGTDGPLPRAAGAAAAAAVRGQVEEGRWVPHFERRLAAQDELRDGYARLLACRPGDVALTTSTSEGMAKALLGLRSGRGDEILTSETEHPGLLGPLIAARARGARIRTAPLTRIHEAVRPATTLVACSHVDWLTGAMAPPELAELDVPVVLDGAQGAGAIPVDPAALGCAVYAAAGQKWLCGADGTGLLYVAPGVQERLAAELPAYPAFAATDRGLDSPLRTDSRAHDAAALPLETVAASAAALGVLEAAGWPAVHVRAQELAATLADRLADAGRRVAPRAATTLVAFEDPEPETTRERLAAAGVVVRNLPGTAYVRASVGAWNDESDLERLLAELR